MQKPKKILSSKIAHKNPFYQVRRDEFIRKKGTKGKYYTVVVNPFVVICPLGPNQKSVYLVKTWRYPLNRMMWELPAGRVDKNETPLMAAKRELLEETGYKAKKWRSLGWFYLAPGISNQRGYIFTAERLEKIHNELDTEIVEVKKFTMAMFKKMLKQRKIVGAPDIVASQRLFSHKKK
jgi:ADP-ribose pyrophosphatase